MKFKFVILLVFLFSFISLVSLEASSCVIDDDDRPNFYYVMAPSGLNLRKTDNPKSAKVGHVAYGEKLELVDWALDKFMEIDQLKGGMTKVLYNGQEGYVFDGYLSQFPAAKNNEETEMYVERIRDVDIEVLYEEHKLDWGGYMQFETVISLPSLEWQEVFLVAQNHFGIPKGLLFPGLKGEKELSIQNPEAHEFAWSDELNVVYDEQGALKSISYNYRGEGGGSRVTISYPNESNSHGLNQTGMLRISSLVIVD